MFGFPTRVRSLYFKTPESLDKEQDAMVSDRPIGIAVAQFSPGAEVVKDKRLHVCAGFAAWKPQAGGLRAIDSLGPARSIGYCRDCGTVTPTSRPTCNVCGTEV